MILAAGRGQRLRPLTDRVPKPLLRLGGETLLGRHLRRLARAGVERVVVNTAWHGQMIRDYVGNGERFGVEVTWSDEGETALETGGGILRALPSLGELPFLVLNGDVWTDLDPGSIAPPGDGDLALLVLVDNPDHNPAGDFSLHNGRIVPHHDDAATDAGRYTFSGISVLAPGLFSRCQGGAFPLAPLLQRAINAGRVAGRRHSGAWFDIGAPDRLAAARRYIERH